MSVAQIRHYNKRCMGEEALWCTHGCTMNCTRHNTIQKLWGVRNQVALCEECGYMKEFVKLLHQKQRAVDKEFTKVAEITI